MTCLISNFDNALNNTVGVCSQNGPIYESHFDGYQSSRVPAWFRRYAQCDILCTDIAVILIPKTLFFTAAIAIAECLPENNVLSRLDLSGNPSIGLAGLLALSVSCKMSTALTFLDITIPVS